MCSVASSRFSTRTTPFSTMSLSLSVVPAPRDDMMECWGRDSANAGDQHAQSVDEWRTPRHRATG